MIGFNILCISGSEKARVNFDSQIGPRLDFSPDTLFVRFVPLSYWIIKGNEFDTVGLYMSFQNGDWTIND